MIDPSSAGGVRPPPIDGRNTTGLALDLRRKACEANKYFVSAQKSPIRTKKRIIDKKGGCGFVTFINLQLTFLSEVSSFK